MKSLLGMWKLDIPFSNKEEPQALPRRRGKKHQKKLFRISTATFDNLANRQMNQCPISSPLLYPHLSATPFQSTPSRLVGPHFPPLYPFDHLLLLCPPPSLCRPACFSFFTATSFFNLHPLCNIFTVSSCRNAERVCQCQLSLSFHLTLS